MIHIQTIDDMIDYLNVIKKHGSFVLDSSIETDGGEFNSIDINIRTEKINIDEWKKDHEDFFSD